MLRVNNVKQTDILKVWQLIKDKDTKLNKIDTQQVNKVFNNVYNNIINTSRTSTSV